MKGWLESSEVWLPVRYEMMFDIGYLCPSWLLCACFKQVQRELSCMYHQLSTMFSGRRRKAKGAQRKCELHPHKDPRPGGDSSNYCTTGPLVLKSQHTGPGCRISVFWFSTMEGGAASKFLLISFFSKSTIYRMEITNFDSEVNLLLK